MNLENNFKNNCHVQIVIFGASGDLATKKLFPSLWSLYVNKMLPNNIHIIGFGRSNISINDIQLKCEPFLKKSNKTYEEMEIESKFWALNKYMCGKYNESESFEMLNNAIIENEINLNNQCNRLFYLAIPPNIYESVISLLSSKCKSKRGWTRIIIEKPFGKNLLTSEKLSKNISKCFDEKNIFRIDHYLGKEMVQSLLTLRFANKVFDATWDNKHIASILITFKESIGIENRGGYFDSFGIIRDVLQNHLVQIFTLIAMDKPDSLSSCDIQKKKVQILKEVETVTLDDTVLGQYENYTENKSVLNKESKTATYAALVFRVKNTRWQGVPFILKCGKGLNERKTEIRIQYKNIDDNLFAPQALIRNELVILVQPNEAVYLKFMTKFPGIDFHIKETELDLTYKNRFIESKTSEAYERLILEVLSGSQTNFVSSEELSESWRILTPLLNQIDEQMIIPHKYKFKSRGPVAADILVKNNDYIYSNTYQWTSGI